MLADAGLIVGEKRGRWVWWCVVPERVQDLRDIAVALGTGSRLSATSGMAACGDEQDGAQPEQREPDRREDRGE